MNVVLTNEDYVQLQELIFSAACPRSTLEAVAFQRLSRDMLSAQVVFPEQIPPDVVTMNSIVLIRDRDYGECRRLTVSWPDDADSRQDRISVLSTLGIALLGAREGDYVEWVMPTGKRKLLIQSLVFQPETAKYGSTRPEAVKQRKQELCGQHGGTICA